MLVFFQSFYRVFQFGNFLGVDLVKFKCDLRGKRSLRVVGLLLLYLRRQLQKIERFFQLFVFCLSLLGVFFLVEDGRVSRVLEILVFNLYLYFCIGIFFFVFFVYSREGRRQREGGNSISRVDVFFFVYIFVLLECDVVSWISIERLDIESSYWFI